MGKRNGQGMRTIKSPATLLLFSALLCAPCLCWLGLTKWQGVKDSMWPQTSVYLTDDANSAIALSETDLGCTVLKDYIFISGEDIFFVDGEPLTVQDLSIVSTLHSGFEHADFNGVQTVWACIQALDFPAKAKKADVLLSNHSATVMSGLHGYKTLERTQLTLEISEEESEVQTNPIYLKFAGGKDNYTLDTVCTPKESINLYEYPVTPGIYHLNSAWLTADECGNRVDCVLDDSYSIRNSTVTFSYSFTQDQSSIGGQTVNLKVERSKDTGNETSFKYIAAGGNAYPLDPKEGVYAPVDGRYTMIKIPINKDTISTEKPYCNILFYNLENGTFENGKQYSSMLVRANEYVEVDGSLTGMQSIGGLMYSTDYIGNMDILEGTEVKDPKDYVFSFKDRLKVLKKAEEGDDYVYDVTYKYSFDAYFYSTSIMEGRESVNYCPKGKMVVSLETGEGVNIATITTNSFEIPNCKNGPHDKIPDAYFAITGSITGRNVVGEELENIAIRVGYEPEERGRVYIRPFPTTSGNGYIPIYTNGFPYDPKNDLSWIEVAHNQTKLTVEVADISYYPGQDVLITVKSTLPVVVSKGIQINVNDIMLEPINIGVTGYYIIYLYKVKPVDTGEVKIIGYNINGLFSNKKPFVADSKSTDEDSVTSASRNEFAKNVGQLVTPNKLQSFAKPIVTRISDDGYKSYYKVELSVNRSDEAYYAWIASNTEIEDAPEGGLSRHYVKSMYYSNDFGVTRSPLYVTTTGVGEVITGLYAYVYPKNNLLAIAQMQSADLYIDFDIGSTVDFIKETDKEGAAAIGYECRYMTEPSVFFTESDVKFLYSPYWIQKADADGSFTNFIENIETDLDGIIVGTQDRNNIKFYSNALYVTYEFGLRDLNGKYMPFTFADAPYMAWVSSDETVAMIQVVNIDFNYDNNKIIRALALITPTGKTGTVTFQLTVSNGDFKGTNAFTAASASATFKMGLNPFLSVPKISRNLLALQGTSLDVPFTTNLIARNYDLTRLSTTFTLTLYRTDAIGVISGDPVYMVSSIVSPSNPTNKVTIAENTLLEFTDGFSYAARVSAAFYPGIAEPEVTITSQDVLIRVKELPAKATITDLVSDFVLDDKDLALTFTLTNMNSSSVDAEWRYSVVDNGTGAEVISGGANANEITDILISSKVTIPKNLIAVDRTQLKRIFTVILMAHNSAGIAWSVDSRLVYVYNAEALSVLIKSTKVASQTYVYKMLNVGTGNGTYSVVAAEGDLEEGGVHYKKDKNGSHIRVYVMDNIDYLISLWGSETSPYHVIHLGSALISLEELRDEVNLQSLISINYNEYVWGMLSDQIVWASHYFEYSGGKLVTTETVSSTVDYMQGGLYTDITKYRYPSYLPTTEFLLVGHANGINAISATHVRTGMTETVHVQVSTMGDKLFLFSVIPKSIVTVSFDTFKYDTDGRSYIKWEGNPDAGRAKASDGQFYLTEKLELTTDSEGYLALYEPRGIQSTVVFTSSDKKFMGAILQKNIYTSEADVASLQIYPLNTVKLRSVGEVTLYIQQPNGTPYANAGVRVRGGVYLNGSFVSSAYLYNKAGQQVSGITGFDTTTDSLGRLFAVFNPAEFGTVLSLSDELEYIFDLSWASSSYANTVSIVPAKINVEQSSDAVKRIEKLVVKSTSTPTIYADYFSMFYFNPEPAYKKANNEAAAEPDWADVYEKYYVFSTEMQSYSVASSTYDGNTNYYVRIPNKVSPGKAEVQAETGCVGPSTHYNNGHFMSIIMFQYIPTTINGSSGMAEVVAGTNLSASLFSTSVKKGYKMQTQQSEVFCYPFSTFTLVRLTYDMTWESLSGCIDYDCIDKSETYTPWLSTGESSAIQMEIYGSGLLVKTYTPKYKFLNGINIQDAVTDPGLNDEVGRVADSVNDNLDIGSVFNGLVPGGDMLVMAMSIFSGLSSNGQYTINAMTIPTSDPFVFRVIVTIGEPLGAMDEPPESGPVSMDYEDSLDFEGTKKSIEEFQEMLKEKDNKKKKGGDDDGGVETKVVFSYYGTTVYRATYDNKRKRWDMLTISSETGAKLGVKASYSQNFIIGPVPITISFDASAFIGIGFGVKSATLTIAGIDIPFSDLLLTLEATAGVEAFAGIGVDFGALALKLGIFGNISAAATLRLLTSPGAFVTGKFDDAFQIGTQLNIKGEIGIKMVLRLLFVTFEQVFASTGFDWTKSWGAYDDIISFWKGTSVEGYEITTINMSGGATMRTLTRAIPEGRDYLTTYQRDWVGGVPLAVDETNKLANIQTNAYPFSNPIFSDDGVMLLYLSDIDNLDEPTTRVSYAVKNAQGGFDDMGPLYSSCIGECEYKHYGDSYHALAGNANISVAAWCVQTDTIEQEKYIYITNDDGTVTKHLNTKSNITNEELSIALSSTEVFVATYTTGTSKWNISRLTTNALADLSPAVAVSDNGAYVLTVWRSAAGGANARGNPLNFTTQDEIHYSIYDTASNTWGTETVLYDGGMGAPQNIECVVADNGKAMVAFTAIDNIGRTGFLAPKESVYYDSKMKPAGTLSQDTYVQLDVSGLYIVEVDSTEYFVEGASVITEHYSEACFAMVDAAENDYGQVVRLTNNNIIDSSIQTTLIKSNNKTQFLLAWFTETDSAADIQLVLVNDDGTLDTDFLELASIKGATNTFKLASSSSHSLTDVVLVWLESSFDDGSAEYGAHSLVKAAKLCMSASGVVFTSPQMLVETEPFTIVDHFDAYTVTETDGTYVYGALLATNYNTGNLNLAGTVRSSVNRADYTSLGEYIVAVRKATENVIFTYIKGNGYSPTQEEISTLLNVDEATFEDSTEYLAALLRSTAAWGLMSEKPFSDFESAALYLAYLTEEIEIALDRIDKSVPRENYYHISDYVNALQTLGEIAILTSDGVSIMMSATARFYEGFEVSADEVSYIRVIPGSSIPITFTVVNIGLGDITEITLTVTEKGNTVGTPIQKQLTTNLAPKGIFTYILTYDIPENEVYDLHYEVTATLTGGSFVSDKYGNKVVNVGDVVLYTPGVLVSNVQIAEVKEGKRAIHSVLKVLNDIPLHSDEVVNIGIYTSNEFKESDLLANTVLTSEDFELMRAGAKTVEQQVDFYRIFIEQNSSKVVEAFVTPTTKQVQVGSPDPVTYTYYICLIDGMLLYNHYSLVFKSYFKKSIEEYLETSLSQTLESLYPNEEEWEAFCFYNILKLLYSERIQPYKTAFQLASTELIDAGDLNQYTFSEVETCSSNSFTTMENLFKVDQHDTWVYAASLGISMLPVFVPEDKYILDVVISRNTDTLNPYKFFLSYLPSTEASSAGYNIFVKAWLSSNPEKISVDMLNIKGLLDAAGGEKLTNSVVINKTSNIVTANVTINNNSFHSTSLTNVAATLVDANGDAVTVLKMTYNNDAGTLVTIPGESSYNFTFTFGQSDFINGKTSANAHTARITYVEGKIRVLYTPDPATSQSASLLHSSSAVSYASGVSIAFTDYTRVTLSTSSAAESDITLSNNKYVIPMAEINSLTGNSAYTFRAYDNSGAYSAHTVYFIVTPGSDEGAIVIPSYTTQMTLNKAATSFSAKTDFSNTSTVRVNFEYPSDITNSTVKYIVKNNEGDLVYSETLDNFSAAQNSREYIDIPTVDETGNVVVKPYKHTFVITIKVGDYDTWLYHYCFEYNYSPSFYFSSLATCSTRVITMPAYASSYDVYKAAPEFMLIVKTIKISGVQHIEFVGLDATRTKSVKDPNSVYQVVSTGFILTVSPWIDVTNSILEVDVVGSSGSTAVGYKLNESFKSGVVRSIFFDPGVSYIEQESYKVTLSVINSDATKTFLQTSYFKFEAKDDYTGTEVGTDFDVVQDYNFASNNLIRPESFTNSSGQSVSAISGVIGEDIGSYRLQIGLSSRYIPSVDSGSEIDYFIDTPGLKTILEYKSFGYCTFVISGTPQVTRQGTVIVHFISEWETYYPLNLRYDIKPKPTMEYVPRTSGLDLSKEFQKYIAFTNVDIPFRPAKDDVVAYNAKDNTGFNLEGWSWDHITQTLTFKGVTFMNNSDWAIIYMSSLNLCVLKDTVNTINPSKGGIYDFKYYSSMERSTITGGGTLNFVMKNSAAEAMKMNETEILDINLHIRGKTTNPIVVGKLTVDKSTIEVTPDEVNYSITLLNSSGNTSISNSNIHVVATLGSLENEANVTAIYSQQDLFITNTNIDMSFVKGKGSFRKYYIKGIQSGGGSVNIRGGDELKTISFSNGIDSGGYTSDSSRLPSWIVAKQSVNVSGKKGRVKLIFPEYLDRRESSYWITCEKNIDISNSIIVGGKIENKEEVEHYYYGDVLFNTPGSVTFVDTTMALSDLLRLGKTDQGIILFDGVDLTLKNSAAMFSQFCNHNSITFKNSTIKVIVGGNDTPVFATNDITFQKSKIELVSLFDDKSNESSFRGIQSKGGTIYIEDSSLEVKLKNSANYSITASNGIVLTGISTINRPVGGEVQFKSPDLYYIGKTDDHSDILITSLYITINVNSELRVAGPVGVALEEEELTMQIHNDTFEGIPKGTIIITNIDGVTMTVKERVLSGAGKMKVILSGTPTTAYLGQITAVINKEYTTSGTEFETVTQPKITIAVGYNDVIPRTSPLDLTQSTVTYTSIYGVSITVLPTDSIVAANFNEEDDPKANAEGWSWNKVDGISTFTLSGVNFVVYNDRCIDLPASTTMVLANGTSNRIRHYSNNGTYNTINAIDILNVGTKNTGTGTLNVYSSGYNKDTGDEDLETIIRVGIYSSALVIDNGKLSVEATFMAIKTVNSITFNGGYVEAKRIGMLGYGYPLSNGGGDTIFLTDSMILAIPAGGSYQNGYVTKSDGTVATEILIAKISAVVSAPDDGQLVITGTYTMPLTESAKVVVSVIGASLTSATGGSSVVLEDGTDATSWFTDDAGLQAIVADVDLIVGTFTLILSGAPQKVGTFYPAFTIPSQYFDRGVLVSSEAGAVSYNFGKKPIEITTCSADKIYDGLPLSCTSYEITKGSLNNGDQLSIVLDTSIIAYTKGGKKNTPTSLIITNASGDAMGYYNVTIVPGTLRITTRTLTVKSGSSTKMYDGTPLVNTEYEIVSGSLVTGDTLRVVVSAGATDVLLTDGVVQARENTIVFVAVNNLNLGDVTNSYSIVRQNGTVTVTKSIVTVAPKTETRPYNGQLFNCNEVDVIEGSFAPGEGFASQVITGEITDCGEVTTTIQSYVLSANTKPGNYDITTREGVLIVTKRIVRIVANSAKKEYDATPLSDPSFTIQGDGFLEGEGLEPDSVIIEGTITTVGSVENNITSYNLIAGTVEDNYIITTEKGTLTITPVAIAFATGSKEKEYDGQPLKVESLSITSGLFLPGHAPIVTMGVSITEAGTTDNDATFVIKDSQTDEDVTTSYQVTKTLGTLTVTKRPLTISTLSDTKLYDRTPLTKDGYNIDSGTLATGDTMTVIMTGTVTSVGSTDNTCTISIVHDETGAEVEGSYELTIIPGTLSITKATQTLNVTNVTLVYTFTGSEQTVTGATVEDGEQVVLYKDNVFTNVAEGDGKVVTIFVEETDNYKPAQTTVTISVAKKPLIIPTSDLTMFVYNGSSQTYNPIGFDNLWMTIIGNTQTVVASSGHTVTVDIIDTANCEWNDGTTSSKTFSFIINKRPIAIPDEDSTQFVYSGTSQTYNPIGFDSSMMTIDGDTRTEANPTGYTVTVSLIDPANNEWEDGTAASITYSFVIAKKILTKPVNDTTQFVYNGVAQTYNPTGFDDSLMIIENETQTLANPTGYTVTVSIADTANYEWEGGSTSPITFNFIITKDASSVTNISDISKKYDGTPVGLPTYTVSETEGLVSIEYHHGTDKIDSAPAEPGAYTVVVSLAESTNYLSSSAAQIFSIFGEEEEMWQTGVVRVNAQSEVGELPITISLFSSGGVEASHTFTLLGAERSSVFRAETGFHYITITSGTFTDTQMVYVKADEETDVFVTITNTRLKTNAKGEATGVFVNKLATIFHTVATNNEEGVTQADLDTGADITITANVETVTYSNEEKKNKESIPSLIRQVLARSHAIARYFNISITKRVGEVESTLSSTPTLLEVAMRIPDAQRKAHTKYSVYRVHNRTAEMLSGDVGDEVEGFSVTDDGKYIILQARFFSIYALGYSTGQLPWWGILLIVLACLALLYLVMFVLWYCGINLGVFSVLFRCCHCLTPRKHSAKKDKEKDVVEEEKEEEVGSMPPGTDEVMTLPDSHATDVSVETVSDSIHTSSTAGRSANVVETTQTISADDLEVVCLTGE